MLFKILKNKNYFKTDKTSWQKQNLIDLKNRTAFQSKLPQGIILNKPDSQRQLSVQRKGDQLQLFFYGTNNTEVMSRMDVSDPLNLVSPYTQAMLLPLLWNDTPKRIYMLGLGAGRVPMVLHHYLPETIIDCAELDAEVVDLAQSHFGIKPDDRLNIHIEDGRKFLENKQDSTLYDVILIDAFIGTGGSPLTLSTHEFYRLCKSRMSKEGVIAINLLFSDTLYEEKIHTLNSVFQNMYQIETKWGGTVLIATDSTSIAPHLFVQKAREIEDRYGFTFPYSRHAKELRLIRQSNARLLSDSDTEFKQWIART
jgi:spermidine synthase